MIEDLEQLKATTEGLLRIREEVERLLVDTMDLEAPLPRFTWALVERQLTELAASDEIRASVATHVSAHRKQAWAKPPELVLRELLCLAWVMLDEDYRPGVDSEGEDAMT